MEAFFFIVLCGSQSTKAAASVPGLMNESEERERALVVRELY